MKFLDLCAGIGGFSLGLERAGMTCAGQVEIDPFCIKVLEKHWPHVPRWKDLKNEHEYSEYPAVDLVCGGYPCQPFSYAGKREGEEDDRHLWPYVFKVVQRLRPSWCLFENVVGHVTLGLDTVLSDLEGEAYSCQPLVIPACSVDAPHIRKRVWILAHTDRPRFNGRIPPAGRKAGRVACGSGERVDTNPDSAGRQELDTPALAAGPRLDTGLSDTGGNFWAIEPDVGRVGYGIPYRMDKLKSLGNAVVPILVEQIGLAIVATHYQ